MRCACAILPSVACLSEPYFPALPQKRHDFRKKNIIEKKMCGLIFCTNLSEIFRIQRRTERDIINLHSSLSKVTHMSARFS